MSLNRNSELLLYEQYEISHSLYPSTFLGAKYMYQSTDKNIYL